MLRVGLIQMRCEDEDFPGGGYVFAPSGERLYTTAGWLPGAAYLELDFGTTRVTDIHG